MFEQEHPMIARYICHLTLVWLLHRKKEIHEGADTQLIPEQVRSYILSPKVFYRLAQSVEFPHKELTILSLPQMLQYI